MFALVFFAEILKTFDSFTANGEKTGEFFAAKKSFRKTDNLVISKSGGRGFS
jgi:hypothetical protein